MKIALITDLHFAIKRHPELYQKYYSDNDFGALASSEHERTNIFRHENSDDEDDKFEWLPDEDNDHRDEMV